MFKPIAVLLAALALLCAAPPSFAQSARPYDLAQLSPEVRAAVESARDAQRQAMRAAARADGNAAGYVRFAGASEDHYAGECSICTVGNSQRHGFGVLSWTDGELYAGQHVQNSATGGRKHGFGVYMMANGAVYEGEFRADRRAGYGVMWDPQGNLNYQGQWANDQRAP
jgi:hypothetical protein